MVESFRKIHNYSVICTEYEASTEWYNTEFAMLQDGKFLVLTPKEAIEKTVYDWNNGIFDTQTKLLHMTEHCNKYKPRARVRYKNQKKEKLEKTRKKEGYYDGKQIVVDEADRKNFNTGDEVIITILDRISRQKNETRAEKRRRLIDSDAFVISTGRTAEEIDNSIKEMRNDNRF